MVEMLFRKFLDDQLDGPMAECLARVGVEGILREFEIWLERKNYIDLHQGNRPC